jgi:hypothetical protein
MVGTDGGHFDFIIVGGGTAGKPTYLSHSLRKLGHHKPLWKHQHANSIFKLP